MTSFYTVALTLFLTIDSLGIIPDYLHLVESLNAKKKKLIALRELLFALLIMLCFHFVGAPLLGLLSLNRTSIEIAGGIVIFLIAIRLIFPPEDEPKFKKWKTGIPFIVPIATPLMAGPSVLAMIMIYSQEGNSHLVMLSAIILAWLASGIVFFFASPLYRFLGDKGLGAIQRLMGLLIVLVAIQMFLTGIKELFLK